MKLGGCGWMGGGMRAHDLLGGTSAPRWAASMPCCNARSHLPSTQRPVRQNPAVHPPAERSRFSVYMWRPGAPAASSRWHIIVPRLIP
jgi:hypothetical protein